MSIKVRKAKSLPDTRLCDQTPKVNKLETLSCDEGRKKTKKKKKKKAKTVKKAKTT